MNLILIAYCSVLTLCLLSKGQEEEFGDECYTSRISTKIIGGEDAREAEFPFAASIQRKDDHYDIFCNYCGGVIITDRLILTAAHCIFPGFAAPNKIRIVAGTIDLEKLEDAQIAQVDKVYIHPDFKKTTKANDFAIVVIKHSLKFTKHVRAVHLPTQGREPIAGSKCTAIGWGRTSLGGPRARILQEVELTIEERDKCQKFLNSSGNSTRVFNRRMFCSYDIDTNTNKGDSGSAMMCKDQDQHFYLGGFVSSGLSKCGDPSCSFRWHMTVFTHVGQFYCDISHYIAHNSTNTKHIRAKAPVETNLKQPSKKICRSSNRNKTYQLSPKQDSNPKCLQNEDPCDLAVPGKCCTGYCRLVSGRGEICTRLQQDDPRGDPANDAFEIYNFLLEHFLEYKGWLGAIWWEFNNDHWLTIDDAKEVLREEIVNTHRYMSDTDTCCVADMYKLESKVQKCVRIEHRMILLQGPNVATPRASYAFQTNKGMVILITNGTQVDILKGWNIVSDWKEIMIRNHQ